MRSGPPATPRNSLPGRPAREPAAPSFLAGANKTSWPVCLAYRCVPELSTSVQAVRAELIIGIAYPMKPLTEWFNGMNIGGSTLFLAVAAGLVVLLVFILLGRRREPPRDFRPIHLPQSPVGSADWESPLQSA